MNGWERRAVKATENSPAREDQQPTSLQTTETFRAGARRKGARIGVSRLRWVGIDETDR